MEDYKLLTQADLAKRWQVTKTTIENWRKDGVIQSVKGIPAIRFTPQHITELEGVKLEKFSPLLKNKMDRELEGLRAENERLKTVIKNVFIEILQAKNVLD